MNLDAIRAAVQKVIARDIPPPEQDAWGDIPDGHDRYVRLDPQTVLRLLDVVEAAQKFIAFPAMPKDSLADASLKYLRAKLVALDQP